MVQKICYCSIKLVSYESYHVFKVWDGGQGKGQGQTRPNQTRTKTKKMQAYHDRMEMFFTIGKLEDAE